MRDRSRDSKVDSDAEEGTNPRPDPSREGRPSPGRDEDDPYESEDLERYPEWWRRNVETFRAHGMRPYRPPRFSDGVRTPDVIDRLERDLGVPVRIRTGGNATSEPDGATPAWTWEVWVDDEAIGTVDRRRDGDGYTVYEMSSFRFERLVRSAVNDTVQRTERETSR